ncbi:uncharacterized protein LOC100678580 [Nasonia vitripennis]|uniref:Protein sleepless n=1 Tax=Nasonia vitripennis TaxID=7425 RepID=A0A7M7GGK7_NASVI|nr:uncharacterized protein LOC100678580 [Nasonia vitripennis]
MCSKRMSVSSAIAIALLVFYSVDQASALKCYSCESFTNGPCWTDPKSGDTQNCGANGFSQMLQSSAIANATVRTALVSGGSDDGISTRVAGEADCAKFIGTFGGQKYIAKMCTVKSISCEYYASYIESRIGYKVESCHRCDGDFCNSSNNLNAGIMCLAISVILAFFFKM